MICPICHADLTDSQVRSLWAQLCNQVRWASRKASMEQKPPKKHSLSAAEVADLPTSERMRLMREGKL